MPRFLLLLKLNKISLLTCIHAQIHKNRESARACERSRAREREKNREEEGKRKRAHARTRERERERERESISTSTGLHRDFDWLHLFNKLTPKN